MSQRGIDARALRAGLALAAVAFVLPGCYTTQLMRLQQGLDSLRVVADTMQARDSTMLVDIAQTRRDIDEQRDLLMGTRASSGTVSREIFDTLARLEAKVDELAARLSARPASGGTGTNTGAAPGVSPEVVYDQAAMDLTQGRYGAALNAFRDFIGQFPRSDLADNARFGVAECFFAQAQYDSAAAEYAALEHDWPSSDKAPAALYKLALCYERQDKKAKAEETLQTLVKRFPNSGEAQLARERLGAGKSR